MSKQPQLDAIPAGMGLFLINPPTEYDYEWWDGRLIVWEAPDPLATYVIGVDSSQGVGEDRAVIEVIRVGDKNRPDEQVAEFASSTHSPTELSGVAAAIGRFYAGVEADECLAVVECNPAGGGDTTQFDMRTRYSYDNLYIWKIYDKATGITSNKLGWFTTPSTRPRLLARGVLAIIEGDLIINSPFLLEEMQDFVADYHMAKAQARHGRHDDRIMALFMAYWGAHDDEWIAGEDIAMERKRLTLAQQLSQTAVESPSKSKRTDYQNTACSYDEMMSDANDRLFDEY